MDLPDKDLLFIRVAVCCSRPGCGLATPCPACAGIMRVPLIAERFRLIAAADAEPPGPDRDALAARITEIERWLDAHPEAAADDDTCPWCGGPMPCTGPCDYSMGGDQ
jgi:hypothetical protein